MNCKPGDLAVIVRSIAGNEGKIVRCLRLLTDFEMNEMFVALSVTHAWLIDRNLQVADVVTGKIKPYKQRFCPDFQLRPIRDPGDDAVDETLLWLPNPTKEIA